LKLEFPELFEAAAADVSTLWKEEVAMETDI
jgi:hypothetical protein